MRYLVHVMIISQRARQMGNPDFMKANKFFSATIMASLFLASFMIGCSDNSTDPAIDSDAPVIFSTSPTNGENDVVRNKVVEITFDQAMDQSTINTANITMMQESTPVYGSIDYSGTTATFTPENVLAAQAEYVVTVSTGVKSSTGVELSNDNTWSFTTGGSNEQVEAVDLGTAGNYVVLAKSAINNNPTSAFTGDLGLSPMAESFITPKSPK